MPVITINGVIGSGQIEVGQIVSRQLNLNYVDRFVFAEAAKLMKAPVGALIEKEQRVVRFRDRLASFLQTMLERSALAGVAGEPYFGRSAEMLPSETYPELAGDPSSRAQQVNDSAFIKATTVVIRDLAIAGDVVIIGRGANVILKDMPGALHVGMVAPMETRIAVLMQREHFNEAEAHEYAENVEQARQTFFRKFFRVQANDPQLFHLTLNMGRFTQQQAADLICEAASKITKINDVAIV